MPSVTGRFLNQEEIESLLERRLPRVIQYATGATLNASVRQIKANFFDIQQGNMVMRSRGFARASTRYDTTRLGAKIDAQRASVYTQTIDRGTGWLEQPVGGADRRKRKWSVTARRGGRGGVVQGKYRMKQGYNFPHLNSATGETLADLYYFVVKHNWFNLPIVVYENTYGIQPGVVRMMRKEKQWTAKDGRQKQRKGYVLDTVAESKDSRVSRVDIVGNMMRWLLQGGRVYRIYDAQFRDQVMRGLKV